MDAQTQAPAATLLDAITVADAQLERTIDADAAAAAASPPAERFVVLSIGPTHYAVPESFVTELERVPAITPVPHAPAWLRGITNLRGDMVSVIDMRTFLGLELTAPHTSRMLVVRLLDEEFSAGLVVDSVSRIVAIPPDAITLPASPLQGPLAAYLRGVCTVGERLVAVLDLDQLLRSRDIRQFEDPSDVDVANPATAQAQRGALLIG